MLEDKTDKSESPAALGFNYLRLTGMLDAYEHVIELMISEGWPANTSVHEHAAYLLLKWHSDHKEMLRMQE